MVRTERDDLHEEGDEGAGAIIEEGDSSDHGGEDFGRLIARERGAAHPGRFPAGTVDRGRGPHAGTFGSGTQLRKPVRPGECEKAESASVQRKAAVSSFVTRPKANGDSAEGLNCSEPLLRLLLMVEGGGRHSMQKGEEEKNFVPSMGKGQIVQSRGKGEMQSPEGWDNLYSREEGTNSTIERTWKTCTRKRQGEGTRELRTRL